MTHIPKLSKNTGPCMVWPWAKDEKGYPKIRVFGKNVRVQRAIYRGFFGEFPSHLVVDHICRNRGCINPRHLRAITNKENIMCGMAAPAINARKPLCKRGHKLKARERGWRVCRTCQSLAQRDRYRKKNGVTKFRKTKYHKLSLRAKYGEKK